MWHQRGIVLEQKVYHLVCASLTDDYEGVRLAAVKLVCVFSLVYPDQSVVLLTYLLKSGCMHILESRGKS